MSKKRPNRADSVQPYCIVTPASVARGTRARQPTKNFGGLFRGKFPSSKMNRMIHWESLLERDAIMIFEFSPGVALYREQPFSTYFFFDGRMRRYTPDFEITLKCGSVSLIEVKPLSKLQRPEVKRRFDAIRAHFEKLGCSLMLLDETHIRNTALLKNLSTAYRYRMPSPTWLDVMQSKQLLNAVSPLTFETAVRALGSERAFWQMVAANNITLELRSELTADTPCAFNEETSQDERIYL